MLNRLGHILLIVAVIAATGTHWLVMQSVAWSTMLASNLQTATLSEAVELTFSGRKPCNLCKHITQSKQEEKKCEFSFDGKRLEFSFVPGPIVFTPAKLAREVKFPEFPGAPRNDAPPSPPPERLHG